MIALLIAGAFSLFFALIVTPVIVRVLHEHGIGQQIREDGPVEHLVKAGTPTMGGICIVSGAVMGYFASHIVTGNILGTTVYTSRGLLCVAAIVCAGIVGALDDWLKIRNRRNLGLNKKAKIIGQLAVAIGFVVIGHQFANLTPTLGLIGQRSPGAHAYFLITLPVIVWAIATVFILIGSANAVNLTDGLDGLAAGSSAFAFASLAIVAFWEWRHGPDFAKVAAFNAPYALDLAIFAVALVTACAGFLWWNAAPARIFMGDTGSLAIGTGMAALAICLDVPLLLPIVGGLFVVETLSVIAQIISFRIFHKRIFRMAPLHHHFELRGWPETTVIVRFWIVAGLFMTLALGIFYAAYQFSISGIK
jgi:phospho-N-acetylmuramoyl-pentapeptide-transferase